MYHSKIEEQLKKFKETSLQNVKNPICRQNYLTVMRGILIAESLDEAELVRRAHFIKPLVRLRVAGKDEKPDLWCYPHHYVRDYAGGESLKDDILVWTKPVDIALRSYVYDFRANSVVQNPSGNPLAVGELIKVAEFTCYHDYGGHYAFPLPGVAEILRQIPADVKFTPAMAFEVRFTSMDINETFDRVLDRHVSTVILYALADGLLPDPIRRQPVIYKTEA